MTVDLRSIPTQVIIQGETDLDVSEAFISLSISGTALDDSGWFKPRGQIVLGQLPGFAESFDCRTNPGRWAPGNVVAVSVWLGGVWVPLPWRLRILAYPNRPMPGNRTITLEIGTDADLLNYRAPEGDPGTDEYGTPTGATFLINRALSQAGAPSLIDTITTLNLPFSPEKNTGGSWMTYAGTVAYASRHILWQQADGAIRATPLTLDALTPTASYTIGTDEADYVLSAPGEQPPEIVQVQGTTYLIEDATPQDSVVEEIINGVLTRTEVNYKDWATFEPRIIETVSIPLNLMSPGRFPSISALFRYRRITTRKTYDKWDRLVEEFTEVEQPSFLTPFMIKTTELTVVGQAITTYEFPLSFVSVNGDPASEQIVREVKTSETMTRKVTVERSLFKIGNNPVDLEDRTVTTETWEKKGPELYLYRVNVRDVFPELTALPPRKQPSQFSPPPATTFRPAAKQRTEMSHSGKATFTNAVGSSFAEKKWVISLPSGMGISNSQCRAHAALWGKVRQGRQFKIRWSADLTADWLTNFSPIARVDFDLDGLTTAYLVEGFSIEIDQRSAAIGGLGLEIGQVDGAALVPPYRLIPEAYHVVSIGGLIMAAAVESTVDATHAVSVGGLTFAAEIGALMTDATFAAAVGGLTMAASVDPVIAVEAAMDIGGLTFASSVDDRNVAIHAVNVGGLTMAASGEPVVAVTHAVNVGGVVMAASVEPVVWTPAELTTVLWLDSSDNATLFDATTGGSLPAADGGVARWEDKSGNAHHLTQATSGLRPIRKVANQNGLDGVQFNSDSTHWIENASATFGLINRTAFVVFKENSTVANGGLLVIKPTAGGIDFDSTTGYVMTPSNRTTARFIAAGSTGSTYEILDTTIPSTIFPATIYGEVKSGSTGTLYHDGTIAATDSSFTEFAATSGGGVSLGARYLPSRSGPYFNGVVYEIVYVDSALSTDDRQKLEGYLAHKWGTTASLPSDHPYKSVAP